MLGIHLKRLAEYDLQRQGWERRIGWYLVFQMNNQASKMTFQDVTKDGKTRTLVTPQHPAQMRTVLNGSHVPWEETARTNPGKVIKQWGDALETLRKDGIIGPCPCLDGAADGSDLPARGPSGGDAGAALPVRAGPGPAAASAGQARRGGPKQRG